MKKLWIAALLLATACATPAPPRPDVRLDIATSIAGDFTAIDIDREPETRRYRIKPGDLLASSAAAEYDGRPAEGRRTDPERDSVERLTTQVLAEAARVIRTFVAPGSWDADPRRALYVEKDELVVRHAPSVLAQVDRLLETLKANRDTQLRLHVSYVSIPIEDHGILRQLPTVREGLGGIVRRKSVAELKARQADLQRVTVSGAPRMTLFHGQQGLISIGSRFPYIKAVSVNDEGYEPKIDVVLTGMDLRVRAVRTGPDSHLLDAAVEVQDLAFMTTMKLADHYIQFPVKIANRTSGAFVLGPDDAALLVTPPIRTVDGILGSLGSHPPGKSRINLVIIEIDGVE